VLRYQSVIPEKYFNQWNHAETQILRRCYFTTNILKTTHPHSCYYTMILFAYAGNMNMAKFVKVVPSAKKISNAMLPGYEFQFSLAGKDDSTKANVVRSGEPGAVVWGILIDIADDERFNFFNPDPDTNDLTLEPVPCFADNGKKYAAEAFMAKPHAINTYQLPYEWHHERIIKLAEKAGLPPDYIAQIAAMPHKPDPDTARSEQRRKKFNG
jgi:gamma-glutamylcyclotransferase